LKFYLIHVIEYMLLGIFASGVVIRIYHALIAGDSAIEWKFALAAGAIFGFFSLTGTGTTLIPITCTESWPGESEFCQALSGFYSATLQIQG